MCTQNKNPNKKIFIAILLSLSTAGLGLLDNSASRFLPSAYAFYLVANRVMGRFMTTKEARSLREEMRSQTAQLHSAVESVRQSVQMMHRSKHQ